MKVLLKNSPGTIVDVRTQEEFGTGHVPGAINIPLNEIPNRVEEIKHFSKPIIIIYCQSGHRSNAATSFLQLQGVAEVFNGGGLQDMLCPAQ